MKFECHITCPKADAEKVKFVADLKNAGWAFSQIDGDPVMGMGSRCYLTRYDSDYLALFQHMTGMAMAMMHSGVPVLRQKIELIMFDSLNGGPQ